jgi:hypothetical protein
MNRGSIIVFLSLLMTVATASAAGPLPAYIPLQGYLTDAEGLPLEGEHMLHLSLYDGDTTETALYQESQVVFLDHGHFTVYLGTNKPLNLEVVRDSDGLVLGVAVDSDPEMTPRLAVGTTPYAAYAQYTQDAETLEGRPASDFRLADDKVEWSDVENVPGEIQDGDADTLQGLSCSPGQVTKRTEDGWICADDNSMTPAEVEALVENYGYSRVAELAPIAFTGSFTDLTGTPGDLLDGDDDTLGFLSCVSGQTPAFNGSTWVCSNRARDTLASMSCADGQTAKWNASQNTWVCGNDADTTLTEADVLQLVAANDYVKISELSIIAVTANFEHLLNIPAGLEDGDDDSLGHLACAEGQVPKWGPTGWICAFDQDSPGDITNVTAGTGLDGGGDVGAVALRVDPTQVQLRVTGTCPAGESIREIDADGNVLCEKDTLGSLTCETTENVASGASTEVLCPAGSVATGGGGDCANDHIITSGPSGNGWRIRCQTAQANIKVWAICCSIH